jgi:penicillin-binding protein 2
MKYFGLNSRTGVQIGEHFDIYDPDMLKISSPAFKEYSLKSRNPNVSRSEWEWFDGDMVKTSIGQGYNAYTSAMMVRYISVIANRGKRYPLTLLNSIVGARGEIIMQYNAVPEYTGLAVSERTWDAVIEGMRLATQGRGTAANAYRNFPIPIAGKTGTAQESSVRNNHSSFGGFAPHNDPQIAVYVSLPYGDTRTMPSTATQVARDVIGVFMGLETEIEYPNPYNALTR